MQIKLTLWSQELNVLECVAKQCLALELKEQCKKKTLKRMASPEITHNFPFDKHSY